MQLHPSPALFFLSWYFFSLAVSFLYSNVKKKTKKKQINGTGVCMCSLFSLGAGWSALLWGEGMGRQCLCSLLFSFEFFALIVMLLVFSVLCALCSCYPTADSKVSSG